MYEEETKTCLGCLEDLPLSMYPGVKKKLPRCGKQANGCHAKYQRERRAANKPKQTPALTKSGVINEMLDSRSKRMNLSGLTEAEKQARHDAKRTVADHLSNLPRWCRDLAELKRLRDIVQRHGNHGLSATLMLRSRVHGELYKRLMVFAQNFAAGKWRTDSEAELVDAGDKVHPFERKLMWMEARLAPYVKHPELVELAYSRELKSILNSRTEDDKQMREVFGTQRKIRSFWQSFRTDRIRTATERRDLKLARMDQPVDRELIAREELWGDAEVAVEARRQFDIALYGFDRITGTTTQSLKAEAGFARVRNSGSKLEREVAESKMNRANDDLAAAHLELIEEARGCARIHVNKLIEATGKENPTWSEVLPDVYNCEAIEAEFEAKVESIKNPEIIEGDTQPTPEEVQATRYVYAPSTLFDHVDEYDRLYLEDGPEAAKQYEAEWYEEDMKAFKESLGR